MAFNTTRANQGALAFAAHGATVGNTLRKKYGAKAAGIGAGIGAAAGYALGGLSGSPDPNLGRNVYRGAYQSLEADTMRRARETARAVGEQANAAFARRGINASAAAAGVQAANQGRVMTAAQQSLLPYEADFRMRGAQDRLQALRVGEHENRQGWMDAALAVGTAVNQISGTLAQDHERDQLKAEQEAARAKAMQLPGNFRDLDPKTQAAMLGIDPDFWAGMPESDRWTYLQHLGYTWDPTRARQEYLDRNKGYPGIKGETPKITLEDYIKQNEGYPGIKGKQSPLFRNPLGIDEPRPDPWSTQVSNQTSATTLPEKDPANDTLATRWQTLQEEDNSFSLAPTYPPPPSSAVSHAQSRHLLPPPVILGTDRSGVVPSSTEPPPKPSPMSAPPLSGVTSPVGMAHAVAGAVHGQPTGQTPLDRLEAEIRAQRQAQNIPDDHVPVITAPAEGGPFQIGFEAPHVPTPSLIGPTDGTQRLYDRLRQIADYDPATHTPTPPGTPSERLSVGVLPSPPERRQYTPGTIQRAPLSMDNPREYNTTTPAQRQELERRQNISLRGTLSPDTQKELEEQAKTATTPQELAAWRKVTPQAIDTVMANPTSVLAAALLAPHTGHMLASTFAELGDTLATEVINTYNMLHQQA